MTHTTIVSTGKVLLSLLKIPVLLTAGWLMHSAYTSTDYVADSPIDGSVFAPGMNFSDLSSDTQSTAEYILKTLDEDLSGVMVTFFITEPITTDSRYKNVTCKFVTDKYDGAYTLR